MALRDVLAVEQADNPLGRYRIVFITSAPLPPVGDLSFGPRFLLGSQHVKLPGAPSNRTLLSGYFDELPAGTVPFSLRWMDLPGGNAHAVSTQVMVNAEELLARSRPDWGEYEASHIQRSEEVLDVWALWCKADVVFQGRFVRWDAVPAEKSIWRVYFTTEKMLHCVADVKLPELAIFRAPTVSQVYELHGTYIVFAGWDRAKGQLISEPHNAVRVWWPKDDFVLDFLVARAGLGDAAHTNDAGRRQIRALLVRSLYSPAAEVRRSAAAELLTLPGTDFRLTADEAKALGERASAEPSPQVRQALLDLVQHAGL